MSRVDIAGFLFDLNGSYYLNLFANLSVKQGKTRCYVLFDNVRKEKPPHLDISHPRTGVIGKLFCEIIIGQM